VLTEGVKYLSLEEPEEPKPEDPLGITADEQLVANAEQEDFE
jgi:hypothetical protein